MMNTMMRIRHQGTAGRRAGARGFSLMEVLISLLVLAIGLLGLAALQTQGVRFNQDAYLRSQATILAYEMMDSMRARREDPVELANFGAAPLDDAIACDPTDPDVAMELRCWLDRIQATFGEEAMDNASVTQLVAPDENYWNVTIGWVDREPRDFNGTTRLPTSAGECEARDARQWDGLNGVCLVTQSWTFWP